MEGRTLGPEFIRKTKRKPLACVQCRLRKVRCNKRVPCQNCIARGLSSLCHREVVLVRGVVTNKQCDHGTKDNTPQKRRNGLFNDDEIENIRTCVEMLTFGYIKLERLFKAEYNKDVDWPKFYDEFSGIMERINHSGSHSLCAFATYYINFIHNAVVPTLFMNEHEVFWNEHVIHERDTLIYFKPSSLQISLPRDYYFWMAMYYTTICNGIYFGSKELKDELDFSEGEIQSLGPLFFRAAYDCLCKAQFMDVPDIRSIQAYCLMSVCFHAYGSVGLSQSLLVQCVGIARKLKLDIPDSAKESNFSLEIKKRLWYTLCLIDWLDQIDKTSFYVENTATPFPALITDELLLSGNFILEQVLESKQWVKEYSSVYYQHVMVEMAQIKKLLFYERESPFEIVQGWGKMNKLRETTIKMYLKNLVPLTDDLLTYDHARFLLFSSLTEEVLDFGRRVLAIVGKKVWAENYRSHCIKLALENIAQGSITVPAYYRKHWIIPQHHIYAALTILLDMIMFPEEDDLEEYQKKLELVNSLFPIFKELEATHLPAKLGLALLPRLCELVRFVRVDKQEGNISAMTSLRDFFDDLQVRRDPQSDAMPDLQQSQYFRFSNATSAQTNPNFEENSGQELDFGKLLLNDTDIQKLLSDTGWSEVLMNIFEPNIDSI